jgi:O-antigen ligase
MHHWRQRFHFPKGGRMPVLLFLLFGLAYPLLLFPNAAPALAALAAASLLLAAALYWRGGRALPEVPLNGWLALYLFLSAVAFLLAPPGNTVRRLTPLMAGVMLYGAALVWIGSGASPARRRRLLAVGLALSGGGAALAGLLALEWPARYIVNLSFLTSRLPSLGGRFIHPNEMAGVLLIALPFALGQIDARRKAGARLEWLFWLFVSLLIAGVLLLTQSRNAWLALLVALVAAVLWRRAAAWALLLLFVSLLALPLVSAWLSATFEQPLQSQLDALDAGSKLGPATERSWLERLEIWRAAVSVMGDYPVTGAGLYRFVEAARANEVFHFVRPTMDISHAHNLFLQAGASLGWAGWLAIAGLWLSVLYALLRPVSDEVELEERWLERAILASVLAYLVFNTFDVIALEQRAGVVVWLLLALVGSLPAPAMPTPLYRRLPAGVLLVWLLLVLSPALPANLARLELDRMRAGAGQKGDRSASVMEDHLGEDARRLGLWRYLQGDRGLALVNWSNDHEAVLFLEGQGQQAALVQGDPDAAVDWYSLALALDGRSATTYYWRGLAYEALAAEAQAFADYQQAVTYGAGRDLWGVDLRAVAWERQGSLLARWKDWAGAVEAFSAAAALEPEIAGYQIQLADVQRALEEWQAAVPP